MRYLAVFESRGPLTLDGYQRAALRSDQNKALGPGGIRVPLLGLYGEVGSLLSLPKRQRREKPLYESFEDSLIEETGDVLWYLANLASRHKTRLSTIARSAEVIAGEPPSSPRQGSRRGEDMTFIASQRRLTKLNLARDLKFRDAIYFALGAAVGRLMSEYASGTQWGLDRPEFLRHLATTYRLLTYVANSADISLSAAAENNLAKIESRWPSTPTFSSLLDENCDEYERLPRLVEMRFEERTVRGNKFVYQYCRGIAIGDRLTDNKNEKDDYRFHDVFHLSYAAVLGWSPVLRSLFKVKRKSKPDIDENEDGARAVLVEEGVASWIFNHAQEHRFFQHTERLDYSLLKAIRQFVRGYEVEACPLWQWERAILSGFRVFRELRRLRRGVVIADLSKRSIDFRAIKR